jgi:hypothetical protein
LLIASYFFKQACFDDRSDYIQITYLQDDADEPTTNISRSYADASIGETPVTPQQMQQSQEKSQKPFTNSQVLEAARTVIRAALQESAQNPPQWLTEDMTNERISNTVAM